MRVRSLARRTIGIVLVAQVVCAVVLSIAALMHERQTRLRAFDVRLQGRSDSLLGAIQDAEDQAANVQIDPAELRLPSEDVYAVYMEGGPLLGGSGTPSAVLTARGRDGFREVRVGRVRYRVLQSEALRVIDRAEFGGVGLRRPVTIVYASPVGRVWHEVLEAARFYLIAVALAAALTTVLMTLFLREALRPISDLAAAAGALSAPSLVFAAPLSVLRVRELRPLAEVLTEVVERLREAFDKEQRFVGDAAHELKTAIAVVRSSLQVLMLKQRSREEYAEGLERVLEDNSRVELLVGQMLELARMEEALPAGGAALDLGDCVETVLTRLRPMAEQRGLVLRPDCETGVLVRLVAERAQVLVSNLVVNAMEHSRRGQSIAVSVCRRGGEAMVLEVADAGTGIGPETLPHVFERFYREDRSRSRETGGAGLGLAISKSIVDGAGGTIALASAPGAGTTATVTFRPA